MRMLLGLLTEPRRMSPFDDTVCALETCNERQAEVSALSKSSNCSGHRHLLAMSPNGVFIFVHDMRSLWFASPGNN